MKRGWHVRYRFTSPPPSTPKTKFFQPHLNTSPEGEGRNGGFLVFSRKPPSLCQAACSKKSHEKFIVIAGFGNWRRLQVERVLFLCLLRAAVDQMKKPRE